MFGCAGKVDRGRQKYLTRFAVIALESVERRSNLLRISMVLIRDVRLVDNA